MKFSISTDKGWMDKVFHTLDDDTIFVSWDKDMTGKPENVQCHISYSIDGTARIRVSAVWNNGQRETVMILEVPYEDLKAMLDIGMANIVPVEEGILISISNKEFKALGGVAVEVCEYCANTAALVLADIRPRTGSGKVVVME